MTTFETEKNNIPEGATHYYYNAAGFGFYSLIKDTWRFWSPCGGCWKFLIDNKPAFEAFPIPQTNIETPEEKEALGSIASRTCELTKGREREFFDLIDTTLHQYESVASEEVEWVNGDECVWGGIDAVFIGYSKSHKSRCAIEYLRDNCSIIDTVFIDALSKPETPQQREERERLEAAYDLYFEWMLDGKTSTEQIKTLEDFLDDKDDVSDWLRIVDKTNYRKESN